MIMKFKNLKIEKLYKVNYENLSDLCNIRDVIFHNSVNHYTFNRKFEEVDKYTFEDLYNIFRTKSNKLFEFATYSLSQQDKEFNSAFLHALGTR